MKQRKREFSVKNRFIYLREMSQSVLDVLVVGGGITGAGIALDAASRGLTVGLIEKQDFAEGTSSRSTKLVHGGLRYLKQAEIRLVWEVGRERAILSRNAPHIVSAEKMLLPIIIDGTYGRVATSVGLWVYDRLAGVKANERRVMLSKKDALQIEPLLNSANLLGAGLYSEYRTDDARLTIEVLKTACSYGALPVNYAEAMELLYENERIVGVVVHDQISGEVYKVHAKKVVNATGPWVDDIRKRDRSLVGKKLHLTKGVHIVVPHVRLPIRQSVYFDVPDGRMIFAIPRGKCTYIGTTDTDYNGSPICPRVTKQDVSYLIDAINNMFPNVRITQCDVSSSWVGLRPLIHEEGKSPSELSRKDEIFISESGLISIAGGKLTGYRKMAERVVNVVMRNLVQQGADYQSFRSCLTDRIVLSGGQPVPEETFHKWKQQLQVRGYEHDMADRVVKDLAEKYGSNTSEIVNEMIDQVDSGTSHEDAGVIAEFKYCVTNEMATNLSDFLIRRTGRLFFMRDTLNSITDPLIQAAEDTLQWTLEQARIAKEKWLEEYRRAVDFI